MQFGCFFCIDCHKGYSVPADLWIMLLPRIDIKTVDDQNFSRCQEMFVHPAHVEAASLAATLMAWFSCLFVACVVLTKGTFLHILRLSMHCFQNRTQI